jgi:DNA-binding response OmpR family regulator
MLVLRNHTPAKTCPACGQVMVPNEELRLPPIKRRILEIVQRRPGVSAEQLRSAVWEHDPNGGPGCRQTIHVHIHQLNRSLAPLGFIVRARGGAGYRIQKLEDER